MSITQIHIQTDDFDQGALYTELATGKDVGAVVTFVGRVREFADSPDTTMELEHYPGMTEKVLTGIVNEARQRFDISRVRIVHRVGELSPGEQIVFVGVGARHRRDAFAANEFIMDFLKSEAPLWKKEGTQWVAAKASDEAAARTWRRRD